MHLFELINSSLIIIIVARIRWYYIFSRNFNTIIIGIQYLLWIQFNVTNRYIIKQNNIVLYSEYDLYFVVKEKIMFVEPYKLLLNKSKNCGNGLFLSPYCFSLLARL